jgi:DNA-binding PucR family transcriptional regulator
VIEQWAIDELRGWDLSAAEALSTTQRITQLVNGYAEQVVNELIDVYSAERRTWGERSDAAQVARIHAVLSTDTLETTAAEELLGVPLRGWHVAAIIWTDSPEPLRGLRPLLTEISSAPTLTVRVDAGTTWAWLRFTTPPVVDTALLQTRLADHPGLRVALGEPGIGISGFRISHQEALRVRKVAEFDTTAGRQLFDHTDLGLAGLLVDRRDDVRTWVQRTLGELAGPDESMARLRDTLRVFFETNGSYNDTATRMHMHKNTVFKRVRKAEEILAQPIADKRRTIEIAVLLCDQLALARDEHS